MSYIVILMNFQTIYSINYDKMCLAIYTLAVIQQKINKKWRLYMCYGNDSGEYDVCDVTLSVYPHWGRLRNMPGHDGNRTYDLWNTSPCEEVISLASE